ncbi:putative ATP-dependent DNA helicase II subunit 2 [Amylocarpus encephaloides]|uniref:ATP-dependent DNA helicase II subunit 2 n=1 Tax=Amylocarpus encephaloides TaxID=45428 RepID=A0A9P8BZE8_9HELO|nr:putative ATP-dependent DNA helicase II subunit 2 [Amylocarpus encephaloides]
MSGKLAHVYIVDQGSTTEECHSGRMISDLDYALQFVWDKIATVLSANRKTWKVGVLGLRSDETRNTLSEEEGYENINLLQDIDEINIGHLHELQAALKPSSTAAGDSISAIVVAIDMIERHCRLGTGKQGKFGKKIVLVTDGKGSIDDGGDQAHINSIADRIDELDIELVILGTDFDDLDFGFKEEDKTERKRNNEALLKLLTERCNKSQFGTIAEAVDNLEVPEVKTAKPYPTFKGRLSLGDYFKYPETALYIDVQRYFKTKQAKVPSASSFTTAPNGNPGTQPSHTLPVDTEMIDAKNLAVVRNAYRYQVHDPTAPGGKRDVERDDLAKGYEYGRTAVYISEAELNITKFQTLASFSIIGFVPSDKYERYLNMGPSCITIAQTVNPKAVMALSSLIHALFELESYAVARIVGKDGKDPEIILLAPLIEPDLEALIDVPLPFAEDLRMYRFPPLDRVVTTSGATVSKHRNLPSEDLENSMSDYVDAMELSNFGKDEEGQPTEYMTINENYSPAIHRINQAIRSRAIDPHGTVEPPSEFLMQWSNPPVGLVEKATPGLKALVEAADIKKVEAKKMGRRFAREKAKPLSGLDVDSLLDTPVSQTISAENAIPEFKQLLTNTTTDSAVQTAAKQMGDIIKEFVQDSTGDHSYPRALENLKVFRNEMVTFEMPELYNKFMRGFKKLLLKEELGGERREFFVRVGQQKLGLIEHKTVEQSDVTEEQASEFLSLKSELPYRGR